MEKCEDLIKAHLDGVIEKMNSCNMLPFVRKKDVLMMFAKFTDAVTDAYRKGIEENNYKVMCRLAELDKLYDERESERSQTFTKMVNDIKSEMVRSARTAFCHGVCKYAAERRDTTLCYCARRRNFLEALERDLNKFVQENMENITTKFNKVSWKEEK